ncbi:MAG: hypothetical protein ABR535_01585 [Pyrinomonadaceae bacterium]
MQERLAEERKRGATAEEKNSQGANEVFTISSQTSIRKFVANFEQDFWVEIVVTPRDLTSEKVNKFFDSLAFSVTFLAKGGIGAIEELAGLPHGLTESAGKAARKMFFLPQRVNGVPVTVTRPVSFSFLIY